MIKHLLELDLVWVQLFSPTTLLDRVQIVPWMLDWPYPVDWICDINFIINMEPVGQAAEFREQRGPSANAMAFRVKDAAQAFREAIARGDTLEEARNRAYAMIDHLEWPEGFCRSDIGWRAL